MTTIPETHIGSSRVTRRRLVVALAAAGIAAAAAVTAFVVWPVGGRGTLRGFEGDSSFGLPIKHVGGWVTVSGPWAVRNAGSDPLTIERVVAVKPQDGIVLRHEYVLFQSDEIGAQRGWHMPTNAHQLPVTISGQQMVEIELAVQATKPGHHMWRTMQVTYSQGGSTHTLTQKLGVEVCAPATKNCPTPYDHLHPSG
jgi:hypothetical protein